MQKRNPAVEVVCDGCGNKFKRSPSTLAKKNFCSNECRLNHVALNCGKVEVECAYCNTKVKKPQSDIRKSKSGNTFCSRSCRAKYTNEHHNQLNKKTYHCSLCDAEVAYGRKYCDACYRKVKTQGDPDLDQQTIAQVVYRKGTRSNAFGVIRFRARAKVLRQDQVAACQVCGYDRHVEVCHIRAISSFDENATVGEINSDGNLAVLCPNCHWELDHGDLQL